MDPTGTDLDDKNSLDSNSGSTLTAGRAMYIAPLALVQPTVVTLHGVRALAHLPRAARELAVPNPGVRVTAQRGFQSASWSASWRDRDGYNLRLSNCSTGVSECELEGWRRI